MMLLALAPALAITPAIDEARGFMAEYAIEIRVGDRAALAARYYSSGTLLIRGSRRSWHSHAEMLARYKRPAWQPPATFDWVDLRFDQLAPDSVTVTWFDWTKANGESGRVFYHGLLVRDGARGLRIRVEDEARR